jgi:multiple sugar transport system permease protein
MVYRRVTGWLFSLPGLLVLLGVAGFPLSYALLLSVSSFTFFKPTLTPWLGLTHFGHALSDPHFHHSLRLTAVYALLVVGTSLVLGLVFAVLLHQKVRGKEVYYAIISIPMLISPVGVALIWRMILHPELGIVNFTATTLGLPAVDWLGNPRLALATVAFIDVWQQVSFVTLVLLAGLRSIPTEPLEAALVDGATPFSRFFLITLPILQPVIGVVLILQTIVALRTYDLIYVLTRGGPGVSTDLYAYFTYRQAFLGLDLAKASALAVILLAVTLVLVLVYYQRAFRYEA